MMEYTAYYASGTAGSMYPELPVTATAADFAGAVAVFTAWRVRWGASDAGLRNPELISVEPLRIVNDTLRVDHEMLHSRGAIRAS